MKLSVVIPCRNAAQTIAFQLEALCAQQWSDSWEVIVADNGSSDGTQDVVSRYKDRLPGLRLVDASSKCGAAHARNVGAAAATGEAIAFCDADDVVGAGWLSALGNALLRYDCVASCMDVDKLNPPHIAKRLNNVQGKALRRTSFKPYLLHAGSSGMGVRKAVHERAGGFDETLLQREDTDYCFRLQLQGVELHFVREAVIHVRYSSDPAVLFRQARLWAQSQVLMYHRYGTGVSLKNNWWPYLQMWRGLILSAPRILSKETRAIWMKGLGTQFGLLLGVARYAMLRGCRGAQKRVVSPMENVVQQMAEPPHAVRELAGNGARYQPEFDATKPESTVTESK